ncbi:MAG: hypothetical protein HWE37_12260 [Rhodobacteraceae bacterium]|nr:hypothetical protein [Paracoccaceae bacterium]
MRYRTGTALAATLLPGAPPASAPSDPDISARHVADAEAAAGQELEKDERQFDDPLRGRSPERDVGVADGDTVTPGDTTITLLKTQGRSSGPLSTIVPLTDDGTGHKAIIRGGTGLHCAPNAARFAQTIHSRRRLAAMAGEQGFDVFLSNHKSLDATYTKLDAMEAGADGNPVVIGSEQVERAFTAMSHCVAAQLASFDPKAVPTH